jgi:hypothetical protein
VQVLDFSILQLNCMNAHFDYRTDAFTKSVNHLLKAKFAYRYWRNGNFVREIICVIINVEFNLRMLAPLHI